MTIDTDNGMAGAMARVIAEAGIDPAALRQAMEQPTLEDLQRCGPTEHIQQQVDVHRQAIVEHGPTETNQLVGLRRKLAHWDRRLAHATLRDAILDERRALGEEYERCWCLGLGGRSQVAVCVMDPTTPSRVLFSEAEPPLTWGVYCPCPDGALSRVAADVERDRMRREGEGRRSRRLLGEARIPAEYEALDLATYPDPLLAARARRWYADQPKPWLLVSGEFGVGKTGIAIGLVKLALEDGKSAAFRPVPDVLDELRATYGDDAALDQSALLDALRAVDLLVLDDLGAERWTGWVEERMYTVLNARHNERRPTVLTTNLEGDELMARLGERIWWRVKAMANSLRVDGPNLRVGR